jgi:hypothetical protein
MRSTLEGRHLRGRHWQVNKRIALIALGTGDGFFDLER